jgi:hypothetical protein
VINEKESVIFVTEIGDALWEKSAGDLEARDRPAAPPRIVRQKSRRFERVIPAFPLRTQMVDVIILSDQRRVNDFGEFSTKPSKWDSMGNPSRKGPNSYRHFPVFFSEPLDFDPV